MEDLRDRLFNNITSKKLRQKKEHLEENIKRLVASLNQKTVELFQLNIQNAELRRIEKEYEKKLKDIECKISEFVSKIESMEKQLKDTTSKENVLHSETTLEKTSEALTIEICDFHEEHDLIVKRSADKKIQEKEKNSLVETNANELTAKEADKLKMDNLNERKSMQIDPANDIGEKRLELEKFKREKENIDKKMENIEKHLVENTTEMIKMKIFISELEKETNKLGNDDDETSEDESSEEETSEDYEIKRKLHKINSYLNDIANQKACVVAQVTQLSQEIEDLEKKRKTFNNDEADINENPHNEGI